MNNNTLSAITAVAFIVAIAIGLIVYLMTDYGLMIILWVTLLIFGLAFGVLSLWHPKDPSKFGPSPLINNMIIGYIIAMIGVIGLLYTTTDLDPVILIVILLISLAWVIIMGVLAKKLLTKNKEGQ